MSEKLLSLIVPAFNMEAYLRRCLESVIVPDGLDSLEVIVVNDGSTDRTGEIAHDYAARFPGTFRVIDKENGHYGSCVNAGLKAAAGEFVKILEADDWYDTKAFAEFLALLRRVSGQVDVVFSNMACVDADDQPHHYEFFDYPTDRVFAFHEIADKRPCRANTAICYRTRLLRDMGYRQPEGLPYTDNLWTTVPFARVKTCAFFPGVLYRYFVARPGQSMSPDVWKRNIPSMVKVLSFMMDAYAEMGDSLADANRAFVEGSIQNIAEIVYQALFGHAPVRLVVDSFGAIDSRLAALLPTVHRHLGVLEVLNRLGGVPYVRVARKGRVFTLLMVALVRLVYLAGSVLRSRTR